MAVFMGAYTSEPCGEYKAPTVLYCVHCGLPETDHKPTTSQPNGANQ